MDRPEEIGWNCQRSKITGSKGSKVPSPIEPDRAQAIEELREILLRGITNSIATRYGAAIGEAVVQDASLKILGSMEQFEGRSRFTTWAMSIAIRVGISELRRKHYRDVSLESMSGGRHLVFEPVNTTDATPEELANRNSLLQTLRELIDNDLTPKQREATQGILDGLPVEEIARRTGSNRNAVYKLVHAARLRSLRD
jgi:RNA polymerase sigma factor (sigma-70 family)